jgi:hypothetical protein
MIFLKPIGGLCNRIRAIDSMISLCEEYEQNLTIIWLRTNDLNCDFDELFLPIHRKNIKIRIIKNFFIYNLILKITLRKSIFLNNNFWEGIYSQNRLKKKELTIEMADKESFKNIEDFTRSLLKQKQKKILIESCYRHSPVDKNSYNIFHPIEKISNMINNKTEEFNNTIGIHIRRTDNLRSIEVSTNEKVINLINGLLSENPKYTFFLASDCQQTKKKLIEKYNNNIITNPDLTFDRSCRESIQFAVLDLYCLAKTKRIYGSFFSSYSEVAAAINNIDNIIIK